MRRAVLTLGGTVAGLVALFSFKTHSLAGESALDPPTTPASASPIAPATPTTPATRTMPAPSSPTAKSGAGATPPVTPAASAAGKMTSAGTPTPATSPTTAMTTTRTVTGAVASTPYGPMQVQVTLAGTRITAVTVLQQTNDGAESGQIDSFAIPKLTAETLTVQSARIDTVSGATSTSTGYIQSLQSALDNA
jgi:uncharacterized protein with FMN-binding domain